MSWLLAYQDPDGHTGYAVFQADTELDAVRDFRVTFGYSWRLLQSGPAPA